MSPQKLCRESTRVWKAANEDVKSSSWILPLIMGTHKKESSLGSWQQLAKSYQQRFRPQKLQNKSLQMIHFREFNLFSILKKKIWNVFFWDDKFDILHFRKKNALCRPFAFQEDLEREAKQIVRLRLASETGRPSAVPWWNFIREGGEHSRSEWSIVFFGIRGIYVSSSPSCCDAESTTGWFF